MNHFSEQVNFIWSVADLLRGPYKPAQYGRVILPLTVLRRLDCVLAPTKDKVLAKLAELSAGLRKSAAGFRLPGGATERAGSSGTVRRLEDAALNTAKVRQIASLGGS